MIKNCSSCTNRFEPKKSYWNLCPDCALKRFARRSQYRAADMVGSGEAHFRSGLLMYCDDGNGQVWDFEEDSEDYL